MQRLQQQQPQYQTRKEIVEAEGGGGGSSGEEGADFDSDDEGENDSFGEEEDEEDQRQNVAMQGRKALLKLASCDSSDDEEKEDEETSSSSIKAKPAVKLSTDEVIVKNRQRVLILSSRGIVHRYRHLLNDLHVLMPHSKKGKDDRGANAIKLRQAVPYLHHRSSNISYHTTYYFFPRNLKKANWILKRTSAKHCLNCAK